MFTLPLFARLRRMAESIPFLPPFFRPPEIFWLWGTSIAITPSGTQKIHSTVVGGSIRLGHLSWPPPPQQPWHTYSSLSLLWQSLLPWHILCSLLSHPFLFLGDASGPGFWSPTDSSICPSFSDLSPQRASSFLQLSKSSLGWLCFLLWLPLSFCRGILVSLSFLCCYSLHFSGTECGQIFHSSLPHQTPSEGLVVRWSGRCG